MAVAYPVVPKDTTLMPGQVIEGTFYGKGPTLDQYVYSRDNPDTERLNLYVLGRVDYTDELGMTRSTGFCRRFDDSLDRFSRVEDPDHEYAD